MLGAFWRFQRIRARNLPQDLSLDAERKTAPAALRKTLEAAPARITVSETDLQRFHDRRTEQTAMKGSEAVSWAEYMLLEGSASDHGLTTGRPYKERFTWFDTPDVSVTAYAPSKVDDLLNGTDALLFFSDEDVGAERFPMSVDVVTYGPRLGDKLAASFARLQRTADGTDALGTPAYWYDIYSEEDLGAGPKEGKIATTSVAVFLPTEAVQTFDNPNVPKGQSDRIMRDLGPFVRLQIEIQLRQQVMFLLNRTLWNESQQSSDTPVLSREVIQTALVPELKRIERMEEGEWTPKDRALRRVAHQLMCLWKAKEERGYGIAPEHAKVLPIELQKRLALMPDLAPFVSSK
jgi:hypothetical protein